jgi:hypothetical protein
VKGTAQSYGTMESGWVGGFATVTFTGCRGGARAGSAGGLDEVVALMQPTNLASRAVAAKAGFREAGKIEHAGLPHIIYRRVLA